VREATRLAIESATVTRGRLLGAVDREFVVMSDVVELFNSLDTAAIERIIGYLKSRYL
jgi:hypothetical protein